MTENIRKIVRTSIRMDAELHEQLSDYVHGEKKRRKASIDDEIQRAVRMLLASMDEGNLDLQTEGADSQPQGSHDTWNFTVQEEAWVNSLIKVLRSGNSAFIRAVTENLGVFAGYCGYRQPYDTGSDTVSPAGSPGRGSPEVGPVPVPHSTPGGSLQGAMLRIRKKGSRQGGLKRVPDRRSS